MSTILLLAGFGFGLMLTEMFLPGGVLGVLGALALVASAGQGFAELGLVGGAIYFGGLAAVTLAGFCAWMAVFPRTAVGRNLTLGRSLISGDTLAGEEMLTGREGVALSPLRPAGKVLVDGRRVDVVAESEFIEPDAAVVVVLVEGPRVVVRRKA